MIDHAWQCVQPAIDTYLSSTLQRPLEAFKDTCHVLLYKKKPTVQWDEWVVVNPGTKWNDKEWNGHEIFGRHYSVD